MRGGPRSGAAGRSVCALALGAVFLGGITQYPVRDFENGWSLRPILGWESRPPNLPGDQGDARVVGGWFSNDKYDDSHCYVAAFGKYFDDAAAVKVPAAPAPDKGPAWVNRVLDRLRAGLGVGGATLSGAGKPRKFGADPGWFLEGKLEWVERSRYDSKRTEQKSLLVLASAVRRGDFEVGAVMLLETWNSPGDHPFIRESMQSLRILDAKEMAARRAEVEAKEKRAGGGDAAWIARIKARIPPGWKYLRRGEMFYIHDDGVTGTSVENMAARLEAMRKKVYAPAYPPVEDPEAAGAVVMVTRDRRQYLSYGAPENTLGYWSAKERELVLFVEPDSPYSMDRIDVQATLNHEGFHQYLHHAIGGLAAHPWFEEGNGEYYGGWTVQDGVPKRGTLQLRQEKLADVIKRSAWIPMERFLSLDWAGFYGKGEDAVADVGTAYAQAWSVVTFLRDGPRSKLLDGYFACLKDGVQDWRKAEADLAAAEGRAPRRAFEMPEKDARSIRNKAFRKAFEGVEFVKLEQAWLDWVCR